MNKIYNVVVSARTLCHYFAIILSMRYDKNNAKHGNNTIYQTRHYGGFIMLCI